MEILRRFWPAAAFWATILTAVVVFFGLPPAACAQWTSDPYHGMVTVCNAPSNQWRPLVCSLAGGRAFICWVDDRPQMFEFLVYYQVLDACGNPLLQQNGITIVEGDWFTTLGSDKSKDVVTPDGIGGCILVFTDGRDGSPDLYGQRFDSLGTPLWGPTGLPLLIWPGPANEIVYAKSLAADSLGNFFVSCVVTSGGDFNEMYAQKFRADGSVLWGPIGAAIRVQMSPDDNGGDAQCTVADMAGGIIDVWVDCRWYDPMLFVQHLDANGNPLLPINGVLVLNTSGQTFARYLLDDAVPDGQGGGVWACANDYLQNWFYLFRLNGQGHTLWQWTTGNLCNHGFGNQLLRHPSDGTIWFELYENVPQHTGDFLYRFNIWGRPLFGNAGLRYGAYPMVATQDGVIVVRQTPQSALIAARVDSTGELQWQSSVALGPPMGGGCFYWPQMCPDGNDGAVVAFEDYRGYLSHTGSDISAQRVRSDGSLGGPPPPPVQYNPGGQIGGIARSAGLISYALLRAGEVKLELFDLLGRRVAVLADGYQDVGQHIIPFDDGHLASGIYLIRLTTPFQRQAAKIVVVR